MSRESRKTYLRKYHFCSDLKDESRQGAEGVSVSGGRYLIHEAKVQRTENLEEWYDVLGLDKAASRGRKSGAVVV